MITSALFITALAGHADLNKELECLATNIFHEANLEGTLGRMLVAEVVLQRVESDRWPNTICEVVYQPNQFSWTLNKDLLEYKIPYDSWVSMMQDASNSLENYRTPGLPSDHYYAPGAMKPKNSKPKWAEGSTPVYAYGGHVFYNLHK